MTTLNVTRKIKRNNGEASTATYYSGGGGSTPVDLSNYYTKNEVDGNFLPATNVQEDSTVTQNTTFEAIETKFKSIVLRSEEDPNVTVKAYVDEDGNIWFDGAIISTKDVIAYGVDTPQIASVEDIARDVVNEELEANPETTATVDLTSLRIGDTTYHIEGSGGSGGMTWGGLSGTGNTIGSLSYNSSTQVLRGSMANSLVARGYIENNEDLNDYTDRAKAGIWKKSLNATIANEPAEFSGKRYYLFNCFGYTNAGSCFQIIYPLYFGGNNTESVDYMYFRSYPSANEGWTNWIKIPSLDIVNSLISNVESQLDNYLPIAGGQMTGNIIMPANDNVAIKPATNNYGRIGTADKFFYQIYGNQIKGKTFSGFDTATANFIGSFEGPLTGNVTGNVTGNATTATSATTAGYATSAGSASTATTATTAGTCTGNAASATRLQTTRTIWGQSFNGLNNVTGNMTVNGSVSAVDSIVLRSPDGTKTATITLGNDGEIKFNKPISSTGDITAFK